MRLLHKPLDKAKGWFAGPWESGIAVSVGYANEGVNQPHRHTVITEIYLVAQGTSLAQVEGQEIHLQAGDCLIIEPGEAHTFLSSSTDYFHFVIHTPGVSGEAAKSEKIILPDTQGQEKEP